MITTGEWITTIRSAGVVVVAFNPIEDAIYWGKELIPLLREKVKKYHKENVVSAIA